MRATPKSSEIAPTTTTQVDAEQLEKRQLKRPSPGLAQNGCGFFGTACASTCRRSTARTKA